MKCKFCLQDPCKKSFAGCMETNTHNTESTAIVTQDEFAEFTQGLETIEQKIEDQFPTELILILKKISHEIAEVGLAEREACLLNDYPHETFLRLKEQYPIVQQLINVKDLEYKKMLLSKVNKDMDQKMATWMLTAKYSEEFNTRKGTGKGASGDDNNLIAAGIEFVRKNGDSQDLISHTSGKAFLIKKQSQGKGNDILKELSEVLN